MADKQNLHAVRSYRRQTNSLGIAAVTSRARTTVGVPEPIRVAVPRPADAELHAHRSRASWLTIFPLRALQIGHLCGQPTGPLVESTRAQAAHRRCGGPRRRRLRSPIKASFRRAWPSGRIVLLLTARTTSASEYQAAAHRPQQIGGIAVALDGARTFLLRGDRCSRRCRSRSNDRPSVFVSLRHRCRSTLLRQRGSYNGHSREHAAAAQPARRAKDHHAELQDLLASNIRNPDAGDLTAPGGVHKSASARPTKGKIR
jgi:hypothetical protein